MASHNQILRSILQFLFLLLLTTISKSDSTGSNMYERRSPPPANNDAGFYLRIVGSALLIVSLILFGICFCMRANNAENEPNVVIREDEIEGSKQFDLETMKAATSNFSITNWLGEGRLGAVYRGKLQNDQEVAIKRLLRDSRQEITEFINEVQLVAKLQHKNLVRLVGFCAEGEERMLVYEFVSNLSLDKHLFDQSKSKHLTWEQRQKIILGIASGLQYLHEDPQLTIRLCDLKASSILLEQDLNPKISNLAMAKLVAVDHTQESTSFYIKSDVYSFGVILLEIVSGQHDNGLALRARKLWGEWTIDELIDPRLQMNVSRMEVMRCIQIALLCVQEDEATRPTMQAVVFMLNNSSAELPYPI